MSVVNIETLSIFLTNENIYPNPKLLYKAMKRLESKEKVDERDVYNLAADILADAVARSKYRYLDAVIIPGNRGEISYLNDLTREEIDRIIAGERLDLPICFYYGGHEDCILVMDPHKRIEYLTEMGESGYILNSPVQEGMVRFGDQDYNMRDFYSIIIGLSLE